MVLPRGYPIRHFLIKNCFKKNLALINPIIKKTNLIKFTPKSESLIPRLAVQKLSLAPISKSIQKETDFIFVKFGVFMITSASFLFAMTTKKENDNGDILNAETEGTHEVQLIGMDDLDILKDTEFFDYLLQTLTDHYAKLSGLKNVKIRAEFTKEFFARYWLLLMKCAEFDIVPPVNVSDDISAFDSIHRSIFEICESRINLRITTHFILRAEKLANEDEIEARNLFMLVLLFVSEWIADEKENSPNLTFKQSMAKEVHECFCKLFKEIFHGDNEDFKNRVFNENKEMSHSSPLPFHSSPNRSFDTPSLPSLNITPNVQVSAHEKNAQNEFLKKEIGELKVVVSSHVMDEEKLEKENNVLQRELAEKRLEIGDVNKQNVEIVEENRYLQQDLNKKKNELSEANNLIIQKEAEMKFIVNEIESLTGVINSLQMKYDLCNDELSKNIVESNCLKEENEELEKAVNRKTGTAEKLVKENNVLRRELAEKRLEIGDVNKQNVEIAEENRYLQQDLNKKKNELSESNNIIIQKEAELNVIVNEIESLTGVINSLQMKYDLCNDELNKNFVENECLKEENEKLEKAVNRKTRTVEKLEEEKQVLQQALDSKTMELNEAKQLFSRVLAEFRHVLQQLRSFHIMKDEIHEELDAFKDFFESVVVENGVTLANLNVLLNDFVAERLHNISLTNQLETLQDEISSRERSRTPSLHEEGFRTTFNGLPDEEIMSDVMSEPFDDEKDDSSADNDDENGQISKTREVGIPNHREFSIRRHSSSFLSTFLLFFLYLFIFLAIWINLYGALVPSWVYIQVHHDHLPPQ